ncbi:MAG: hypothetical protein Sapg2KO_37700 [Saprospiraceae bacterium]
MKFLKIVNTWLLIFTLGFFSCNQESDYANGFIQTKFQPKEGIVNLEPIVQAPDLLHHLDEEQYQLNPHYAKRSIIQFRGGNNDLLEGYLLLPEEDRLVYNVVVLLHGSGGALDGNNPNTDSFTGINSLTPQLEEWVTEMHDREFAVFVINSFKSPNRTLPQGEPDYIGVEPPNDVGFAPYMVRAEDVKRGVSRISWLRTFGQSKFIGEIALVGFSHGATAAIAAIHDYNYTGGRMAQNPMLKWSVKEGDNEYDIQNGYQAPFSVSTINIEAAIAYYGGTYCFGYFTDYFPGEGVAVKYRMNNNLMIHHGEDDADIDIGTVNNPGKTTTRAFVDRVQNGGANQGVFLDFHAYQNTGHSFDRPSQNAGNNQASRALARTRSFNYLNQHIGY